MNCMSELSTWTTKGGSISPWTSVPHWSRVAPQGWLPHTTRLRMREYQVSCPSWSEKPGLEAKGPGRRQGRALSDHTRVELAEGWVALITAVVTAVRGGI